MGEPMPRDPVTGNDTRGRRTHKPAETIDPVDELLRRFAQALIATAIHVHNEAVGSGLTLGTKIEHLQRKRPRGSLAPGRPGEVSSPPQRESGAAPLGTAGPLAANR